LSLFVAKCMSFEPPRKATHGTNIELATTFFPEKTIFKQGRKQQDFFENSREYDNSSSKR